MPGSRKKILGYQILLLFFILVSCQAVRKAYDITEDTVKATYNVSKFTVKSAYGAGKLMYHVGGFTFKVVAAPLTWPLMRQEIETIDGLPPKEAIRRKKINRMYSLRT